MLTGGISWILQNIYCIYILYIYILYIYIYCIYIYIYIYIYGSVLVNYVDWWHQLDSTKYILYIYILYVYIYCIYIYIYIYGSVLVNEMPKSARYHIGRANSIVSEPPDDSSRMKQAVVATFLR